jgi:hypothetical protein
LIRWLRAISRVRSWRAMEGSLRDAMVLGLQGRKGARLQPLLAI